MVILMSKIYGYKDIVSDGVLRQYGLRARLLQVDDDIDALERVRVELVRHIKDDKAFFNVDSLLSIIIDDVETLGLVKLGGRQGSVLLFKDDWDSLKSKWKEMIK